MKEVKKEIQMDFINEKNDVLNYWDYSNHTYQGIYIIEIKLENGEVAFYVGASRSNVGERIRKHNCGIKRQINYGDKTEPFYRIAAAKGLSINVVEIIKTSHTSYYSLFEQEEAIVAEYRAKGLTVLNDKRSYKEKRSKK